MATKIQPWHVVVTFIVVFICLVILLRSEDTIPYVGLNKRKNY